MRVRQRRIKHRQRARVGPPPLVVAVVVVVAIARRRGRRRVDIDATPEIVVRRRIVAGGLLRGAGSKRDEPLRQQQCSDGSSLNV